VTDTELVEQVRARLIQAVEEAGREHGLLGSHAGQVVRSLGFAPAAHGYGSLRQFMEKRVPELKIIQTRTGSDLRWGLAEWASLEAPAGNTPAPKVTNVAADAPHSSFWRSWVSPNSRFAVVIDDAGTVSLRLKTAAATPGETLLPPVSAEQHRTIARDFIVSTKLPNEVLDDLKRLLESSSSNTWWMHWSTYLKSATPEASRAWLQYRNTALESVLNAGVDSLPLPANISASVKQAIIRSRTAARRQHGDIASRRRPPDGVVSATLRATVQQVVARMTEDQLRALSLPVGLVLDTLLTDQE
jgi:hypothetical protein